MANCWPLQVIFMTTNVSIQNNNHLCPTGEETKIRVFDLAAGQQLIDLKNHTASVKSLCWSSNSKKLMSGCSDGSFYIWNINNLSLRSAKIESFKINLSKVKQFSPQQLFQYFKQ